MKVHTARARQAAESFLAYRNSQKLDAEYQRKTQFKPKLLWDSSNYGTYKKNLTPQ